MRIFISETTPSSAFSSAAVFEFDRDMRFHLLPAKYTQLSVRRLASLPKGISLFRYIFHKFETQCYPYFSDVSGSMPNGYHPAHVEAGWYEWWQKNDYFEGDRLSPGAPFSITLPPPNITGTLHLGHALTCAVQDALIRW